MLTEERYLLILKELEKKDVIKVKELMHLLHVSESTIRRDLQELEDQGDLIRIHGGAKKRLTLDPEFSLQEKSVKNTHEKQAIAQLAASYVTSGEMIYVDAGTTTFALMPYLKDKAITLVTNSVYHGLSATEYGIDTIMIGGSIRKKTKACVDQWSSHQLSQYFFDKAFMGANGVHFNYGITTTDSEEAYVKKTAMKQAQSVYFLVDDSKFDRLTFAYVSAIDRGILVTNQLPEMCRQKYEQIATIKEASL